MIHRFFACETFTRGLQEEVHHLWTFKGHLGDKFLQAPIQKRQVRRGHLATIRICFLDFTTIKNAFWDLKSNSSNLDSCSIKYLDWWQCPSPSCWLLQVQRSIFPTPPASSDLKSYYLLFPSLIAIWWNIMPSQSLQHLAPLYRIRLATSPLPSWTRRALEARLGPGHPSQGPLCSTFESFRVNDLQPKTRTNIIHTLFWTRLNDTKTVYEQKYLYNKKTQQKHLPNQWPMPLHELESRSWRVLRHRSQHPQSSYLLLPTPAKGRRVAEDAEHRFLFGVPKNSNRKKVSDQRVLIRFHTEKFLRLETWNIDTIRPTLTLTHMRKDEKTNQAEARVPRLSVLEV